MLTTSLRNKFFAEKNIKMPKNIKFEQLHPSLLKILTYYTNSANDIIFGAKKFFEYVSTLKKNSVKISVLYFETSYVEVCQFVYNKILEII